MNAAAIIDMKTRESHEIVLKRLTNVMCEFAKEKVTVEVSEDCNMFVYGSELAILRLFKYQSDCGENMKLNKMKFSKNLNCYYLASYANEIPSSFF